MNTICDFKDFGNSKLKVSMNHEFYLHQDDQSTKYYKRNQANYDRISQISLSIRLIDSLGIIHQKNNITVISKFNIETSSLREIRSLLFIRKITELIYQNKVLVACDTLVKNDVIGAY